MPNVSFTLFSVMEVRVNDVVMPGDIVDIHPIEKGSKIVLGPGLRKFEENILITKSGILRKVKGAYLVDCPQKRYIPCQGEYIIGIVVKKAGDDFKVDIGASEQASLSYLSFEGATKKHRPDINVGDALFTKVLTANRFMEPELVCVDSLWKKGLMGLLPPDGFIFTSSLNLVRKCLEKNCPLFSILEKEAKFEIAVGNNGRVWVKSNEVKTTMAVVKTILAIETMDSIEIKQKCSQIFRAESTQV